MHIKTFLDRDRFLAELRNYKFFQQAGFLVPKRLDVRPAVMQVMYEQLPGSPADARQLDDIVDLVVRIHHEAVRRGGLLVGLDRALQKYLRDMRHACLCFNRESEILNDLIGRHFFPSLFRDAKPENWIVSSDGRIFMVDFDYLVTSGPLQDIAQFLTGAWINDPTLYNEDFVFDGMERLLYHEPWASKFQCNRAERQKLFAVAALLSISKKSEYSINNVRGARIKKLADALVDYIV